MKKRCPECSRVFDLFDEVDAEEFYYGHDCDPSLVDENGRLIPEELEA